MASNERRRESEQKTSLQSLCTAVESDWTQLVESAVIRRLKWLRGLTQAMGAEDVDEYIRETAATLTTSESFLPASKRRHTMP